MRVKKINGMCELERSVAPDSTGDISITPADLQSKYDQLQSEYETLQKSHEDLCRMLSTKLK